VDFYRKHPGAPCQINAISFKQIPFSKVDISPSWRPTHRDTTP
jgi:hypothetical protein